MSSSRRRSASQSPISCPLDRKPRARSRKIPHHLSIKRDLLMKSSASRFILAAIFAGCTAASAQQTAPPTAAQADAFLAKAEKELGDYSVTNNKAQWVNNTYITDDSDALAAYFGTIGTELAVRYASESARYQKVPDLSADARRKLDLLRGSLTLPAPQIPGAAAELNEISTRLNSAYGKGRGTLDGKPMSGNDLEEKMGTVRNPAQLQEMWTSWHTNVGGPMRKDYARLVTIANQGAKELGYADTGAM